MYMLQQAVAQRVKSSGLLGCQLFLELLFCLQNGLNKQLYKTQSFDIFTKKAIERAPLESYIVCEGPKLSFVSSTAEPFYLDLSTGLLCSVVRGQMPFLNRNHLSEAKWWLRDVIVVMSG
ncbi:hypothetical protein AMECASPLE_002977 [Ameca splendens]|uniref:Uncharacterized protein n=1 Tax=Ameca splendens TaxID=208324 RepID=A0ABV0ZI63_9TELE